MKSLLDLTTYNTWTFSPEKAIHTYSKISEIHVKGYLLRKIIKGEYEYER